MKNKKFLLIALALLILAGALFLPDLPDGSEKATYPEFAAALEAGTVRRAELYADHLTYQLRDSEEKYRTDNPDRDSFKEELLLKGIEVADHRLDEDDPMYYLDLVFDLAFIGLLVFGVWKLISAYRGTFRVVHHTGITFDKIAGMQQLKKDMLLVVNYLKNYREAQKANVRPIKGIILEGPPGNGKTLFARALAEECGVNFIATKGADFQSALMSMGAMKIKLLFSKARRNKPCILFIDEFDSIGERRNYAGTGIDKENNRIITTMLNEMDGFTRSDGILVIAATNSYASLDPALIRAGRFDLKYHIGNPDAETRKELVRLYTAGRSIDPELTEARLVDLFKDLSCSEIEAILNGCAAMSTAEGGPAITLQSVIDSAKKADVKLNLRK